MRTLFLMRGAPGCVDNNTEFFNGFEWKFINSYSLEDQVLQYNYDGTTSLVFPENYIKEPCNDFFQIKTKYGINQCITKDHNIVYVSKRGNILKTSFEKMYKKHIENKDGFRGKIIGSFSTFGDNKINLSDNEIRLMVAISADGYFTKSNTNYCKVNIKKERKKERLEYLLNKCNIEYKKKSYISGYSYFTFYAPMKFKEFPKSWYSANKQQLKIIYEEIFLWDGSINSKQYFSTIKTNADFIQYVITVNNKRASIYVDTHKKNLITYIVSQSENIYCGLSTHDRKNNIITKYYNHDGFKYCFTVPSGMLVLRRNGVINITGNCGKSTFLKQHNINQYALCADDIRLLIQSPVMNIYGDYSISQANEKKVWELLFSMLETRMERGEFTIIDATNSKTEEMNRYKKLCSQYRYRMYLIDFTNIPIEVVKERNKNRESYKFVPEDVIDKMYARFKTQKVPSGIKIIKPEEFEETINNLYSPLDFSHYKKINHIGDIHGCFTVLHEYLQEGIKDNELYIFIGDYIDRGLENKQVVDFLLSIYEKPNVLLLTGNHEQYLLNFANGLPSKTKEFENTQIVLQTIDKSQLRQLCRKFIQFAYYIYNGKKVLVTHGGLSRIPDNFIFMPTNQLIKGVGAYDDMLKINISFYNNTDDNTYQIHGHRNNSHEATQINERCYNLCGGCEFGGKLRVVELSEQGFEIKEIQNTVFQKIEKKEEASNTPIDIVISNFRQNSKNISERKFGNISSFNFMPTVFFKKEWNDINIKARGIFINTNTKEIVARSYNKFFNLNETHNTKLNNLEQTLSYPVIAYKKYNGYLGLIGNDIESDSLIFTTKSTVESELVNNFKNIFKEQILGEYFLQQSIKQRNLSLVFEVIDPVNEPHIIEYDKKDIILLDAIYKDINYKKLSYEELTDLGNTFGLTVKEKIIELHNWNEFYHFYEEAIKPDYKCNNEYIEGFVFEDANNFMFKLKTYYYNYWKYARKIKEEIYKLGYLKRTGGLYDETLNLFHGWCKILTKEELKKSIIDLRNQFLKEYNENK